MTTAVRSTYVLRKDSVFYLAVTLAMAAVVFVGFSPTYYLKGYYDSPPLTPLRALHGGVFTMWMALLISQTSLIAADRRDLHRRLGWVGAVIAISMVGLGAALAVDALRAGIAPNGAPSPSAFFAIPISTLFAFCVLVGLGIFFRNRAQFHKRFMILATVAILPAAVARFPLPFIVSGGPPVFFALTDIVIVACAAYDVLSLRRVHRATLWGGLIVVGLQIMSLLVGGTAAWQSLTARLVS